MNSEIDNAENKISESLNSDNQDNNLNKNADFNQSKENQQNSLNNSQLLALTAENEDLKQKNQDLQEKTLRIYAELQNYQRRSKEELEKSIKFASNNFINDLIPTIENFFLACSNSADLANSSTQAVKTFFDAIEMTKKELIKTLEKHQVQRIYPQQQIFDHNLHEAISQVTTDLHPSGTIVDVIQAGYKIYDRLIKPALVVVAKSSD